MKICALFLVAIATGLCAEASNPIRILSIARERLTAEQSREFSAGICNASLPVNDHLYQLIDWCRSLRVGSACLSHGAVSCLFKKYIDIVRTLTKAGDGVMAREELDKRLMVFKDNLRVVSREIESRLSGQSVTNAPGAARYGITKFMHLTPAEFRERYLNSLKLNATQTVAPRADGGLRFPDRHELPLRQRRKRDESGALTFTARPDQVDWRTSGVVTAVKDQGACGACWAFAVAEVAESEFAHKYSTPVQLSVQQLTDCTQCPVCAGCRGGEICATANFYSAGSSFHIVEDKFYPYAAKDGSCKAVSQGIQVQTAAVRCESFVNREDALLDHLWQSGTAAVAVDAHMWQYYVDGVVMHNCETELNHAVQLVGYDLIRGPVPFYVARNSWGPDWGMGGYLQIAEGSNQCGLAQGVVTFTVA